MWYAIIYYIFLLLITAIGFAVGYLIWSRVHREELIDKGEQLRKALFQDHPLAKELQEEFQKNQAIMLARSGDIMGLRQDTQASEDKLLGMERRLAQASSALAVNQAELDALRTALDDKSRLLAELRTKLATAEAQLGDRLNEVEALRRRISERDQKVLDLERRISAAEGAISAREEEFSMLRDELGARERELEARIQELSSLQRAEKESKDRLDKETETLDALRQQEMEQGRALAAAQQEAGVLARQLSDLKASTKDVEPVVNDRSERVRALRIDVTGLREQLAGKQTERAKYGNVHSEKETLDTLRAELAELQRLLAAKQHDLEDRRKAHQEARSEFKALEGLVADAADRVKKLQAEVGKLNEQVGAKRGEREKFGPVIKERDALEAARKELADLLRQIADKQHAVEVARRAVQDARNDLRVIEAEVADRGDRINRVESELAAIRDAHGAIKPDKKINLRADEEKLDNLRQEFARLTAQLQARSQDVDRLQKTVADLRSELRPLSIELDNRGDRVRKLETEVAGIRERLVAGEREAGELQREVAGREAELSELSRRLEKAEGALTHHEGYANMRAELSALEKRLTALLTQQAERRVRIQQLRMQADELHAMVDRLVSELKDAKMQLDAVTSEFEANRDIPKEKERAARDLGNDIEKLLERNRVKEMKLREMQERLANVDRTIATLGPQIDTLLQVIRSRHTEIGGERDKIERFALMLRTLRQKLEVLDSLAGERERLDRLEEQVRDFRSKHPVRASTVHMTTIVETTHEQTSGGRSKKSKSE